MYDFAAARHAMVEGQIRTADVTEPGVVDALRTVERERFAPKSKRTLVYGDIDIQLGEGRWLMRPRDFAKLVQALEISPDDVVLDIACGRGYSTAVFARLAETVVGLESDAALAAKASEALAETGADNAAIVEGSLQAGAPGQGPFDVVFVNGAVSEPPQTWFDLLAEGGRLGVVVKTGPVGRATIFTRAGGVVGDRVVFDSAAPMLPGFERPAAFTF